MVTRTASVHDETMASPGFERAPLDSDIRLQQVLDNSSAIVFAKDRTGRYLFVNREFERVTGCGAAAVLGHTDDEVFPAELAARFRNNDLRVLQHNRAIEFEEIADFGGGSRTFLSSKFPLLDSAGAAYAVCCMATDITERKRLEEAFSAAALAVSQSEEETLYRQLARYLCANLGVDGAFIATTEQGDGRSMRMLAFHLDGEVLENFAYPIAGTPCETVVGREFRLYPSRLAELFPHGGDFSSLGLDCYAGQPLTDARGESLGLIAVVSRLPFQDPALIEATMRIFAVRVVAEVERAKSAAALRNSEAQYRAMFNASDDAIVLWNSQFQRVDVNPAFERLYGWTRNEVIGHGVEFPDFLPDHAQSSQDIVRRALAGESCHAEHEIIVKSGARLRAEVRAVPFQHAGQPHVLTIARDITERARAEEALRASEEQYRAVFNASADALVLWNSRYGRVDVNPAYERMYGYSREEVLAGARNHGLSDSHHRQQVDLIARTLAGEHCRGEIDTVRRDGTRFPIEVRTIPIQYHGEPHVLAMIRDLTERVRVEADRTRLEAQLRQAQKMEAIGQLTGGIAHDFNNLLTSIMGYIALAGERESAAEDRRLGGYLAQAQRSCERARDLIQQMLMFSRGHRGSRRAVGLASLVQETLPTLQAGLPGTLELVVKTDGTVAPVLVDPIQVEQVLLNLCINSRDAISGTGTIRIGVHPAHEGTFLCSGCRRSIDGQFVELFVADDGHGMDPEVLERIFEPFFSTKEIGKGSGMGLAMVHGIVHDHGGHVVVESSPGQGAMFRVLWPAVPEGAATVPCRQNATALRPPQAALAGSVLVVDDEETVGEFMRELLESWGLEAIFASRAEAALELVREAPQRFDAVITDQSMPRMTGLELARRLHEIRGSLPLILYTGFGDGLAETDPGLARLCAVIPKPVDPVLLRQTLGKCMSATAPDRHSKGRPPGAGAEND